MSNGGSYDPKTIEPGIYEFWEKGGYFNADPEPNGDFHHEAHEEHEAKKAGVGVRGAVQGNAGRADERQVDTPARPGTRTGRQPYVIMMPPPNVTGALHLGHAMYTLQDVLIRWKRMCGYNALWMPGIDHAGIATQAVVERKLREEKGLTRHEVGREGLVAKIWEWKEEYGNRILQQLRKLGVSCDWRRTRFTLDETCARAVYEMFFELFKAGLIYRGLRLVNWDTALQTAVADDEIEHQTVKGSLWHVRYPVEKSEVRSQKSEATDTDQSKIQNPKSKIEYLVVATTRPETMLADTAVAVHPDDERYKHLIGRRVVLPLTGRTIPVIADGELVKREFGTGCVKVTPGHDPNDYACYQRHKGQPDEIGIRNMMTPDGRVHADNAGLPAECGMGILPVSGAGVSPAGGSAAAGKAGRYAGLKLEEARKKVVVDLEAAGLLEKIEPYETDVGHSDRSKTPIQPYLSEQWFVKMGRKDGADGGPELADLTMEAVRDGRVRFHPARYANTYLDWLGEKRDWCISRQLWWGHRIPVWTKEMSAVDARGWVSELVSYFALNSGDQHGFLRVSRTDGTVRGEISLCVMAENFRAAEQIDAEQAVTMLLRLTKADLEEAWADFSERMSWRVCLRNPKKLSRESRADLGELLEKHGFIQDPDVLDTWFSSALWPMNTLGWPHEERAGGADTNRDRKGAGLAGENAPESGAASTSSPLPDGRGSLRSGGDGGMLPSRRDYDYFFPTDVLCTGRGIITLWVARMVMNAVYFTGRVPFRHVYINPTILDGHGQVMSKSKGNGVDPLDIIELYGTDALRYTLAQMATETQDIRMPVKAVKLPDGRQVNGSEKFEAGRNLANKLWQAANGLVLPSLQGVKIERREAGATSRPLPDGRGSSGATGYHTSVPPHELPLFDRWIRTRLQHCIAAVDEHLSNYRFSAAADELRGFFWTEFCDWYLEEIKVRLRELQEGSAAASEESKRRANDLKVVLLGVFDSILAMFHPIMPFVTEAIWKRIGDAVPGHHEVVWDDSSAALGRVFGLETRTTADGLETRPTNDGLETRPTNDGLETRPTNDGLETRPTVPPALIVMQWPRVWDEAIDEAVDREVGDVLQPVIRALRDIRASVNALRSAAKQPALRTLPRAAVKAGPEATAQLVENLAMVQRLGSCDALEIGPNVTRPAESASKVLAGIEVYVPLTGLADLEIERKRLRKDLDDLTPRIEQLVAKLADENFSRKAPAQLVEKEHARLAEMQGRAEAIGKNLAELGG